MSKSIHISLPDSTVRRVKANMAEELAAVELLESITNELNYYLDRRFEKYRVDALIMELGFSMSRGLVSADHKLISEADRNGQLIDGVPKSQQVQIMAEAGGARIALERAVLASKTGSKVPTSKDIEQIVEIGSTLATVTSLWSTAKLAEQSQAHQRGKPHLGIVSVEMTAKGVCFDYCPGDMDLVRWNELRERPIDLVEINIDHFRNQLENPEWVHPELEDLSRAMEQDLNFGISELLDALSWILRQCLNKRSQFIAFDVGDSWNFGLSEPALEYLVFSDEYISKERLRPAATRHQKRRVLTSPIIRRGNRCYIFRDIIFGAIVRWYRYLSQGDWPVPRNVLKAESPNLYAALERRSTETGKEFEAYVGSKLRSVGLPFASLKNNTRLGSVTASREVDAVVIDAKNREIHVLEFKNNRSDHNSKSLQTELDNFLNKFTPKLKRSTDEISLCTIETIRHIYKLHGTELDSSDLGDPSEWVVKGAFVFNSHSPFECLTEPHTFRGVNADRVEELFA